MDSFTLQSPHFHLVILFLCSILFKISMTAINSNPIKIPAIEIQEGFQYFFINDAS